MSDPTTKERYRAPLVVVIRFYPEGIICGSKTGSSMPDVWKEEYL